MTDWEDRVSIALLSMQRHSWEQGTAMQAFLEMGQLDIVTAMAFEAAYRSMPDGRTATIGVTDGVTDPCSTGEALEATARRTGDGRLRHSADALRNWALKTAPRNENGIVYHLTGGKCFWADSFYMLPPYLAAIGEPEEAMRQFNGYWEALYDPESGLIFHMWDDETKTLNRPLHWGTGNGWTLAAMARMIPMLPDREAQALLIDRARKLLDAVLKWMEPDGAFHDILDDAASFREVNMSQMTAYTIYRGAVQGWLEERYIAQAETMRCCARKNTDEFGFVHQVCGAPTFDRPGRSPEAQAFALMMENARRHWMKKTRNKGERNDSNKIDAAPACGLF